MGQMKRFNLTSGTAIAAVLLATSAQAQQRAPESLLSVITTTQGQTYDADEVENSIQKLTFELGQLGYAFVDVRPESDRDREGRRVAINYSIKEGPRVYVDRINIVGNVRTLDRVVRREMRLAEGDAFNAAKLRRSQQRIQALGFFEKVDIRDDVEVAVLTVSGTLMRRSFCRAHMLKR